MHPNLENASVCAKCGENFDGKDMKAKGEFFVIFYLENKLKSMLHDKDIAGNLFENTQQRQKSQGLILSEIWDGTEYKRRNLRNCDLPGTFNTDGVAVFNISSFSLWIIPLTVNELSYAIRRICVKVAGLWFGRGQPNFNSYFEPIVSAFQHLTTDGIRWKLMQTT